MKRAVKKLFLALLLLAVAAPLAFLGYQKRERSHFW